MPLSKPKSKTMPTIIPLTQTTQTTQSQVGANAAITQPPADISIGIIEQETTMPVEIIPAGASAVVTESDHNKHPNRWDLSTEIDQKFERLYSQADKYATASALAEATNSAAALVDAAKNAAAIWKEISKDLDLESKKPSW
jgi:hypothetical protein